MTVMVFCTRVANRTLQRNSDVIAENGRVIAENSPIHARVIAAVDDMRDQIRANTEATPRLLDRLAEGGNPA